jgi:hypothetical protein
MKPELVLKSLGYRNMRRLPGRPPVWGKPVGSVLFTVELHGAAVLWMNWYVRADTQHVGRYDCKELPADAHLARRLKEAEAFTRIDLTYEACSSFEFCSMVEVLDLESEL